MLNALNPDLAINPTEDQAKFFEQVDPKMPYSVVNLHIYNARAIYPSSHGDHTASSTLTGQQAYACYLDFLREKILPELDGVQLVNLPCEAVIIGDNPWQEVVVGVYANRDAMLSLNQHHLYPRATVHREAGLKYVNTIALPGNLFLDYGLPGGVKG
jgi:hypothetical protein